MSESSERNAHAAFEDLAQRIWDEHKVRINSIEFSWVENHRVDGTDNHVKGASIDSNSYRYER